MQPIVFKLLPFICKLLPEDVAFIGFNNNPIKAELISRASSRRTF